jgi:RHS repeat-associated protein
MLDHDYSSDTDHAQFRQYSSTPGRWMSPDPYYGSYDQSNPQSMDRYAYVSSSPLTFTDPSGLGPCLTVTYQWVAGPAQSNGGHGDEGITVVSYLCDGFSGGSGAGSASAPRPCNPAKSHCGHTQQNNSLDTPDINNKCSVLAPNCKPLPNCLVAGATHVGHAITGTISPLPSVSTGIGLLGGGGDLVLSGSKAVSSKAGPITLLTGFIYNLGSEVLSELETPTPCY